MTGARAWLQSWRARLLRHPRLEDALLGEAPLRYASYRLRLVAARASLRTVFRLAELALFASALSMDVLGPVLLVRSLVFVLEGLWWGALETLRRDVRALHAQRRAPIRVIRQWLALSSCIAVAALAGSVAWVCWGPSPFVGFDVIDVFLLGCATRFGMDSLARTYHSGVYGVRRVYRPAWSVLLSDVADIACLVGSYYWLGAWGLGLSLVVVGVLRTSLSVHFTRRTYSQLRFSVGSLPRWFRGLRQARWAPAHSVASALGNAVAQIDALLVLGLLLAPLNPEGALLLAVLFHGVAPLQAAAFSWSRLFYFDFKRLEAWGSPFLLRRFESFLTRVSLWVPSPIGVATLALLAAFWRGPFWLLALGLTALAAVRARLSLLHMRAYALGDYAFLRKLSFGMVLVVLVTPLLGTLPPDLSMVAVALVAGLGSFVLGKSERPLERAAKTRLVGLGVWLARLANHTTPVRVGAIRVDRRLTSVGRAVRALADELEHAWLTRLGADSFAYFAPADGTSAVDPVRIAGLAAGTLREVREEPPRASGAEALSWGVRSASWQHQVARHLARNSERPIDVAWLRQQLESVAPGARCVELDDRFAGTALAGKSPREVRRLVLEAAQGRSELTRLGDHFATVLAPGGEPRALILIPERALATSASKSEAADLLRCANVAMSARVAPRTEPTSAPSRLRG